MLWFRKVAISLLLVTMLFSILVFSIILNMCSNSSHTKSLDGDPFYNGTLGMYLLIIVVLLTILSMGIWGLWLAYLNWRNNYQMDHKMRHDYILVRLTTSTLILITSRSRIIQCQPSHFLSDLLLWPPPSSGPTPYTVQVPFLSSLLISLTSRSRVAPSFLTCED